jgi:hypothetical protein
MNMAASRPSRPERKPIFKTVTTHERMEWKYLEIGARSYRLPNGRNRELQSLEFTTSGPANASNERTRCRLALRVHQYLGKRIPLAGYKIPSDLVGIEKVERFDVHDEHSIVRLVGDGAPAAVLCLEPAL